MSASVKVGDRVRVNVYNAGVFTGHLVGVILEILSIHFKEGYCEALVLEDGEEYPDAISVRACNVIPTERTS